MHLETCVQIALLHTLLSTLLLVAHVILHMYKCTIMPSVFYSNAALESMFTVLQSHKCGYGAKTLMPCNIYRSTVCGCVLHICMHITPSGAHICVHLHGMHILQSAKSCKFLITTVGTITPTAAAAAAAAVYLEGLICLATVGGTCMIDDFTLQGPSHRVPQV